MFEIGDRVVLIESCGGYGPGAQGTVAIVPEPGVVQVDIDRDEEGVAVDPPDPLPPEPATHFQKADSWGGD